MPVDLSGTLHRALGKLEAEKTRLERQIAGLRQALTAGPGAANGATARRVRPLGARRRGMSAAARKAVSARMKAYWAKRKSARGKGKGKAAA